MEEFLIILAIIACIIICILPIILFFKVWAMTNDVKKIADTVCRGSETSSTTSTYGGSAPAAVEQADDSDAPKDTGEVNDPKNANTIIVRFEDGLVGRLKTYPGYPQYSVITKNGFELLYANKNAALKALSEYLRQGTESQVLLQEKRCWSESKALADKYWR